MWPSTTPAQKARPPYFGTKPPKASRPPFDNQCASTLLSMKHELRVMVPQRSGSIVNVSSAYGSVGAAGASVYVASKHAVEGMTKSAALEVAGTGVRVNVVAPGTTDTGMLTRFTNTDKNKAALISTVPVKRLAHRRRSLM